MTNPTSQFHPYQPETSTPATDTTGSLGSTSGLGGILSKLGIDQSKIGALGSKLNGTNVRGGLNNGLNSVRGMAQKNPGMVLGGLAVLAIGAGLMRRRGTAR
ncbi:MAG TPA: hypothetical protein VM733_18035 [Thermoanaerobaculia bacterium]|nr:hypothetical protein [Thermoanaerobaculia bacterium]